jgi:hypothetical protein
LLLVGTVGTGVELAPAPGTGVEPAPALPVALDPPLSKEGDEPPGPTEPLTVQAKSAQEAVATPKQDFARVNRLRGLRLIGFMVSSALS